MNLLEIIYCDYCRQIIYNRFYTMVLLLFALLRGNHFRHKIAAGAGLKLNDSKYMESYDSVSKAKVGRPS